jgi:hypothetical protein
MAIFKKTSGVVRRGTAAEGAAFTDGFSASGEGQWSRSMAHGGNVNEHIARGRPARIKAENARAFLARTEKQIIKLRAGISIESNRGRRTKIQRDLDCKTALVERLTREIADEITTLPGEGDVEWL